MNKDLLNRLLEADTPFKAASKKEVTARVEQDKKEEQARYDKRAKEFAKIKAKYMADPNSCPHCGSSSLRGDEWEGEFKTAWRDIHCEDCDNSWQEIYTLTDIEDIY